MLALRIKLILSQNDKPGMDAGFACWRLRL
jgi:hypothetical protein